LLELEKKSDKTMVNEDLGSRTVVWLVSMARKKGKSLNILGKTENKIKN
jgi:hypothetical protein